MSSMFNGQSDPPASVCSCHPATWDVILHTIDLYAVEVINHILVKCEILNNTFLSTTPLGRFLGSVHFGNMRANMKILI